MCDWRLNVGVKPVQMNFECGIKVSSVFQLVESLPMCITSYNKNEALKLHAVCRSLSNESIVSRHPIGKQPGTRFVLTVARSLCGCVDITATNVGFQIVGTRANNNTTNYVQKRIYAFRYNKERLNKRMCTTTNNGERCTRLTFE